MQKVTAVSLAVTAVLFSVSIGCSVGVGAEKHTGPVTVRGGYGGSWEMIRANGEIFEMSFAEGGGPSIAVGDKLGDVVYTDLKDHRQFFVKAILVKEHSVPPPEPPEVLYTSAYGGYLCSNSAGCVFNQGTPKRFYKWSDGSYRPTIEPTKKCK